MKICMATILFSLVVCCRPYAGEPVTLHSSSWERKTSQEAVKRYLKFCEQNGQRLKQELELFPPVKSHLSDELKNRYRAKPFIVFLKSINDKTPKYIAPTLEQTPKDHIAMAGATQAWKSIQMGIWAQEKLKNFSYAVSDFVHENGRDRIKGSGRNLRKYYVYNVFARKQQSPETTLDMDVDPAAGPGKVVAFYEEEPVVLLDLPGIDVEPETAQALWLDLYLAQGTAAGNYQATVTFKVEGKTVEEIPLVLTVYPFELDPAKEWGRGAYISNFIDKKEAVNLVENGHNQVSWWTTGGYRIKLDHGNNGDIDNIVADFTPFVDYLAMLDSVGMVGPHVVFLGGDTPKLHNRIQALLGRKGISNGRNVKYRNQYPENDLSPPFESLFINALKQFHAQMKACGHEDLLAVILDEPDHRPRPERLEWYNKTYEMVEKGVPELPTFGVFYHKDDEKKLSHHHAVWSTNSPSVEKYTACKKAGKKLFTYHGGFNFYDKPGRHRFEIGIIPWVYDAAGTFYWAIWNHSEEERKQDDIFSPFAFEGRCTTLARSPLGADYGPLSTLSHRGFREAVDDARYIKTLEKAILAAKGTDLEPLAEKHAKWLAHIQKTLRKKLYVRGGSVSNHTVYKDWHFPVSKLKFINSRGEKCSMERLDLFSDFIRQDVVRRILSLKGQHFPG